MLHYLVYISKAKQLMQCSDLLHLLEESRSWNTEHGITGMLIYLEAKLLSHTEGRFIQTIEGPAEKVKLLLERVKMDPRHHQIVLLKQGVTENRYFRNWQMGFERIDSNDRNIDGFFQIDEIFANNKHLVEHSAFALLKSFYNYNKELQLVEV